VQLLLIIFPSRRSQISPVQVICWEHLRLERQACINTFINPQLSIVLPKDALRWASYCPENNPRPITRNMASIFDDGELTRLARRNFITAMTAKNAIPPDRPVKILVDTLFIALNTSAPKDIQVCEASFRGSKPGP
jgi:hypothetical protein